MLLVTTRLDCDARSTRVSAQYTVASEGGSDGTQSASSLRTFKGKGIVEDATVTDDSNVLAKFNRGPSRVSFKALGCS